MSAKRWGIGVVFAASVAATSGRAAAQAAEPARDAPSETNVVVRDASAGPSSPSSSGDGAPAAPIAAVPPPSGAAVAPASTEPCALAGARGVDPVDAQTAADLVCASVLEDPPGPGLYRVKLSRLEHSVVLSLVRIDRGRSETKSLVLRGVDETPQAAPRLVAAFRTRATPSETATVGTVVSPEAQTPKKKGTVASAFLGLTAVSAVNASMQTRGGVELGASFGSARTRFVLSVRMVGESLMAPLSVAGKIVSLGLIKDDNRARVEGALGTGAIGVRHYASADDMSVFAGGGMGLAYVAIQSNDDVSVSGTGVLPYAEAGVGLLRTQAVGAHLGLRLDVPTFRLEGDRAGPVVGGKQPTAQVWAWPVLASFFLAARF